jgi:hypothetical protein
MAGSAITASAPALHHDPSQLGILNILRYRLCDDQAVTQVAVTREIARALGVPGRTSSDPDISQLSCFRPQCQQGAHVPHPYNALAGRRRRLRSGLRGRAKASPVPLRGDRKRYSPARATDDDCRPLVTLPCLYSVQKRSRLRAFARRTLSYCNCHAMRDGALPYRSDPFNPSWLSSRRQDRDGEAGSRR